MTAVADQALESDAQAGPITRGQTTGCTEKDVSWGVVPHAERTITAGATARKYSEDLGSGLTEFENGRINNEQVATGIAADGVRLTMLEANSTARWSSSSPCPAPWATIGTAPSSSTTTTRS